MSRIMRIACEPIAKVFKTSYRLLRGVNYKTLNQHILSIQQIKDIDSIFYESSRCLKDIFDYQLFAFAICEDETVDVWLDPKMQSDKAAFLAIIRNDLGVTGGPCSEHYFDSTPNKVCDSRLELEDLLSYRVIDADFKAMVYIVPEGNMLHHHHDIVEMMMKVIGTALSNGMRIKRLQQNIMIDPLTSCYNRRALDEFIDQTIDSTRRYGSELSAIMFDLDHFKSINDTYGHQVGDKVLKAVAHTILATIRKCDYLIRYGGEEFILIMPATKLSKAIDVADRLRRGIENLVIQNNGSAIRVTASFGVADLKKDYDKSRLLSEVDRKLYDAKSLGRNRIVPDFRLFTFEAASMHDNAYQYLN